MTYTVVGLLGRGGMAVVELAVDGAGRQVARKRVCLSGSARDIDTARQRIRREAEVLARLHHPGVLPLLAVEDDGTDVVLVMPRMIGSLADRVSMLGPIPPHEMVAIGRNLLDALATAHRQGVIHRDIKPANVLFDGSGRPVLADFGLAVTREFTQGLTVMGMVIGTPEYIAPEQARGGPATPAGDVFSLGATLAYGLTGHGPYGHGDPLVLMARAAQGQVTLLPRTVPPSLRRPLTAMLDPRPERRPSAAGALGGPNGTQPGAAPPAPPRRRRTPAAVVGILALVLVALAALVGTGALATRGAPTKAATLPTRARHGAAPCVPLRYQACGGRPAPFTDGRACLPGHADYDGVAANGCEATSTYQPGTVFQSNSPVFANVVPANAVDTFRTYAKDDLLDFCTGSLRVTLTAPAGVTLRVEVARGSQVIAKADSRDGRPATASAEEPSCFSSNSMWLTVRVYATQGQSATDFRLTRNSGW